eukprot:3302084-Amphidinium_carterae.1
MELSSASLRHWCGEREIVRRCGNSFGAFVGTAQSRPLPNRPFGPKVQINIEPCWLAGEETVAMVTRGWAADVSIG